MYPIYAITRTNGPVVLRSYETESAQRRGYRAAVQTLRDGGFDLHPANR